MRYVVLDTNAIIQALPTRSHYHNLKQLSFPRLTVLTIDEFNDTLK